MNKEEIKYTKTENGYKVTMPLITDDELQKIDYNFHSIVDDYIKEFSNKREKTIEQRLIYDLQQENKQLQDNWNKLKEFINLNYYESFMYSSTIINKMQELEKSDINEK